MRPFVQLAILAIASLFASADAGASCGRYSFRNLVLAEVEQGRFDSRNGEFSLVLPFKKQRIEYGSFKDKCFYAVNMDSLVSADHASVEWVHLEEPKSSEEFSAYWLEFMDEYLARNFGNGRYDLVGMEEYTTPDGRPGFRYAGTGINNTGEPGSIHGVVGLFGLRMANSYFITRTPITDAEVALEGPADEAARRLADSLACDHVVCRKPDVVVSSAEQSSVDGPEPPEGKVGE